MKSTVVGVNHQLGRVIFEREDGEYGWFEILDTVEVERDETVYGDFSNLGGATIKNQDGESIDIFIEDFCSLKLALKHVFPNRR